MDVTGTAVLQTGEADVRPWIEDLATYPRWLRIVTAATAAPQAVDDDGPAWTVDLGARLGPFLRTKRVRMVRTCSDAHALRFERRELDGRTHGTWKLAAHTEPLTPASTRLGMHLHYSGRGWVALLEPVLRQEIAGAGSRLEGLIFSGSGPWA